MFRRRLHPGINTASVELVEPAAQLRRVRALRVARARREHHQQRVLEIRLRRAHQLSRVLLGDPEHPREVAVYKSVPERQIENLTRLRRQHRVTVEGEASEPITARGVAGVRRDLLADPDALALGARQRVEPGAEFVGLAQLTDAIHRDEERVAQRVTGCFVIT